jgi:hypothetical protein
MIEHTEVKYLDAKYQYKFHIVQSVEMTLGTPSMKEAKFEIEGRFQVDDLTITTPFMGLLYTDNILVNEHKIVISDNQIDCYMYSPANLVKLNPFVDHYGGLKDKSSIVFPLQNSGYIPPHWVSGWNYLLNVTITGTRVV